MPWYFMLYAERRNECLIKATGLAKHLDIKKGTGRGDHKFSVESLREYFYARGGTVLYRGKEVKDDTGAIPMEKIGLLQGDLVVDRIYIRKGSTQFSSVSFLLIKGTCAQFSDADGVHALPPWKGRCRFWTKLADVNTMCAEVVEK